jgi:hypothetical protein
MKYKNILLLSLVSLLSFTAHAAFEDEAYAFCTSKGGVKELGAPFAKDGQTCRNAICKKSSDGQEVNTSDVNLQSANIPYAYAGAIITRCVSDSVFEEQGSQSGSQSGAQSGSQSGSQSGAQSGSQSGSQSGAQSGSQSGAQSGRGGGEDQRVQGGAQSGSGGGDGYYCEDLGDYIYDNHPCYNRCKKTWGFFGIWSEEGTERRSCRECLGIRSSADGVYVRGSGSVRVAGGAAGGVYVQGGNQGGGQGQGGNQGGVIHVQGGNQGGGNGGTGDGMITVVVDGISYRIPGHCVNGDGSVKSSCRGYLTAEYRIGGGSGRCEYSSDDRGCIGGNDYDVIVSRNQTGADCVNCQASNRGGQHWLSGVAEIVGAIAPPLAQFGIAYVQSNAYVDAQQAWAGAAETGFEQCRLSQEAYLQYLQTNELPGMTPEQQAAQRCNGYSLGGFAGMGGQYGNGFGGFGNPYIGGGYSGGFMGGMMGPYGGYNPYGQGGMVGGIVGGGMVGGGGLVGGIYAAGGMQGGMVGGYPGGMAGGYAGGMAGGYVGGGYAGGMQGGFVGGAYQVGGIAGGGYVGGGYAGGMQGGYVGGGYAGGMQGGYVGGRYAGGIAGGAVGSIVGGIAGGYAGGMQGGYVGGGYAGGLQGGFQGGGYVGGGFQGGGFQGGGIVGGAYIVAGAGGGGGYGGYPGQGGWGSGTIPGYGGNGGYWGATGGYGGQQMYMQNQQAAAIGSNYQQQALAEQFGMASNNLGNFAGAGYGGGYGGYGSAGFAPGNLSASINAGVGIQF